ncbi:MAG: hypothetical protein WD624_00775, partial [Rhodospirillales bacterium]
MTGLSDSIRFAPVIIVHNIQHVRRAVAAVVAAGRPVTLLSAPDAAAAIGPAVFQGMIDAVLADNPALTIDVTAVVDCGNDPGHALKALREGCNHLRLDADASVLGKLRDMAGADGLILSGDPLPALDLAEAANNDAVLL